MTPQADIRKELETAKRLAVEAGELLLDYFGRPDRVEWKAPGDPVTAADRAASMFIAGHLKLAFPDDGVLSEEEPDDLSRLDRSRVWMVDPMDGTQEFLAQRSGFAVMIGMAASGAAVLGVVYQPATRKLYYAAKGLGAFLDFGEGTRSAEGFNGTRRFAHDDGGQPVHLSPG